MRADNRLPAQALPAALLLTILAGVSVVGLALGPAAGLPAPTARTSLTRLAPAGRDPVAAWNDADRTLVVTSELPNDAIVCLPIDRGDKAATLGWVMEFEHHATLCRTVQGWLRDVR